MSSEGSSPSSGIAPASIVMVVMLLLQLFTLASPLLLLFFFNLLKPSPSSFCYPVDKCSWSLKGYFSFHKLVIFYVQ
jgi:hypothetical protein